MIFGLLEKMSFSGPDPLSLIFCSFLMIFWGVRGLLVLDSELMWFCVSCSLVWCLKFGVLLFARFFVSAFLVNHGGGASSFGYHGAELSLGRGVSCRVGGVA